MDNQVKSLKQLTLLALELDMQLDYLSQVAGLPGGWRW